MTEIVPWVLTAVTLLVTELRLRKAGQANEKNQLALVHLEEGKLDLSVAVLGHDIFMDIIDTLRAEVKECDEERLEMRQTLADNGLIPK